jgi:hypothetical protein
MGLPSGFVPRAPLFAPVTQNVEATRDPSRFSKESTISDSRFPMAALKSSTHFLNALRPSILRPPEMKTKSSTTRSSMASKFWDDRHASSSRRA